MLFIFLYNIYSDYYQPFKDRVDWFYKNLHEDKKRASVMLDEQSILTVTRG